MLLFLSIIKMLRLKLNYFCVTNRLARELKKSKREEKKIGEKENGKRVITIIASKCIYKFPLMFRFVVEMK